MAVHVVKLKRTLTYEVRIDEGGEDGREEISRDEAISDAKDFADEDCYVSIEPEEYASATDSEWQLDEYKVEPDEPAEP